jgi:hypothetical protein
MPAGHMVMYLVKEICYKPEGHRFDQVIDSFQLT